MRPSTRKHTTTDRFVVKIPHWYFLDYLTQYEGERDDSYWDAYRFVKAVKEEEFKGFLRVKNKRGGVKKLTHAHSPQIAKIILKHIGNKCLPKVVNQHLELVPIPNSDMVPKSGLDHPIIRAAQQIAEAYDETESEFSVTLNPALRWTSRKRPSHETPGWRDMYRYEGKLTLESNINNPLILFDDVYTSGSQAKAACKYLSENGHQVLGVLTVAKTTNIPSAKAWSWREGVCEYDEDPFDWDDL